MEKEPPRDEIAKRGDRKREAARARNQTEYEEKQAKKAHRKSIRAELYTIFASGGSAAYPISVAAGRPSWALLAVTAYGLIVARAIPERNQRRKDAKQRRLDAEVLSGKQPLEEVPKETE